MVGWSTRAFLQPHSLDFVTGNVDFIADVGTSASLAVDEAGEPHIAYYDSTEQDLREVHIAPFDAIWTIQVADSVGDVGQWASLDLDSNGDVHIAWYDATRGDLHRATTRHNVSVPSPSWSDLRSLYRPGGTTKQRR